MKTRKWMLLFILIAFIFSQDTFVFSETMTEEQLTAYRTGPAVALIYSGMFVDIVLKSGKSIKVSDYESGTAFFINPGGYMITNGHVVDTFVQYKKNEKAYTQKVFKNFIVNRIVMEYKQNKGRQPGQSVRKKLYFRFMKNHAPRIAHYEAINFVLLANSRNTNKHYNFEVIRFSPSIPKGGKDIAVIKIERDNCPVLLLGDSAKLSLEQTIFAIGYPPIVDPQRFPLLGKESTLKASVTRGAISVLKTNFKGMSVLQHNAPTSPGMTGGPTVDIKGRVIGIHSYTPREYDGFEFCIPGNRAKEFIKDSGIEINKLSDFSMVFNKLMEVVQQEKWLEARAHATTALTYMEGEPGLMKLHQSILSKINEMSFFERIWLQNKFIVIISCVLIVLILVVLKILLTPSAPDPAVRAEAVQTTAVANPETTTPESAGAAPAREDGTAGSISILVKGEDIGAYNVTPNGLIIGRDPTAVDIHIPHDIVSKTHVKIMPRDNQIYLVDLGSTNGTYVNSEKIKESLVKPTDQIQLGRKGEIKIIFKI